MGYSGGGLGPIPDKIFGWFWGYFIGIGTGIAAGLFIGYLAWH